MSQMKEVFFGLEVLLDFVALSGFDLLFGINDSVTLRLQRFFS